MTIIELFEKNGFFNFLESKESEIYKNIFNESNTTELDNSFIFNYGLFKVNYFFEVCENDIEKFYNYCISYIKTNLYNKWKQLLENDTIIDLDDDFSKSTKILQTNKFDVYSYDSSDESPHDKTNIEIEKVEKDNINQKKLKYFIEKNKYLRYNTNTFYIIFNDIKKILCAGVL